MTGKYPHPSWHANGWITLLTDFGTVDGYVGALKGCLASLAPQARLCDLSHDLPPQDVRAAAWCLKRSAACFPAGTVHLAVVDPGVGSQRAPLVVRTRRSCYVGPDNGLLSLAVEAEGLVEARRIRPQEGWSDSATFDGLSLFAPVAAHLACGGLPSALGPSTVLRPLECPQPIQDGRVWRGEILLVDRFGNCITNLRWPRSWRREETRVRWKDSLLRIETHYEALKRWEGVGALVNSDGLLELAAFADSFAVRFGARRGAAVQVVSGDAP